MPGVTERDLQLDPYTGRYGVILDSGITVTRLALPVYIAIRDALRTAAADLGQVSIGGHSSFFDTCYIMGREGVMLPTVGVGGRSGERGGAREGEVVLDYLLP